MLRALPALVAVALPIAAFAQSATSQAPGKGAPPPSAGKPSRPPYDGHGHRPASGNGNRYQPVIVVDPTQYLQQPAPAATKKPAAHAPKKTPSGEDVFETHSTENP